MWSINKAFKNARSDFLPILAVLATGAALSVCALFGARAYYLNSEKQEFQRSATYYSTSFKAAVERHVVSLAAIHAFVTATHDVTRWEFSAFAHQILPQNSGFKAVLWLPYVPQIERKAFEDRLQRDGLYGLRLRELTQTDSLISATTRPAYLPVAYVEPFESGGGLIGVDLFNNNIYAPLFHAAQQTHRAVASRPLARTLVEGTQQPIVLLVFPLNRRTTGSHGGHGSPHGPEGYVLGILQLDRIIGDTIGPGAPIRAAIEYRSGSAPPIFISQQRDKVTGLSVEAGDSAFRHAVPFEVAGQHFLLMLRSEQHAEALTLVYVPAGAALLVLALTALLALSMFNAALRKLAVERAVIERTAELRNLNGALRGEVEQRRHAEAALWLAKDKAETANRAKSAFLATMSHELRTPLNAIIGFSSMLLDNPKQFDERSIDYHHEINASGVRLLDLINDILEITQMDTEDRGCGEPIYLPDIIENVIAKTRPAADKVGISLKCSIADRLPLLRGDGRRLQKALFNLLSNAVKFTESGGWAQISATADAKGLMLAVSDNGVGMPPGVEARIVDLFSQCDTSLKRKHEGMGLGLAFVGRVAENHGAKLQFFSKLGEGTMVTLTFPSHCLEKIPEVA